MDRYGDYFDFSNFFNNESNLIYVNYLSHVCFQEYLGNSARILNWVVWLKLKQHKKCRMVVRSVTRGA